MRLQDGHHIANIAVVPKEEDKDEQITLDSVLEPKTSLKVEEKGPEPEAKDEQSKPKSESLFDLLGEE
jgi:hypothetical protein